MEGEYFEDFIAELFHLLGYDYQKTPTSGDQGLDLILYRENKDDDTEKIGVQCKRFKSSVSNKAIQEAFAGSHYYECDRAIVIAPSKFTKSAKDLAVKLGIELIDGYELDKILLSLQEYLEHNFFKHEKITEILINSSIDLALHNEVEKSIQLLSHLKEYSSFIDTNHLMLLFNNLGLSLRWNNENKEAINIYLEGIKSIENSAEDKFTLINNCLIAFRECNLKKEALQFIKNIEIDILSPPNLELLNIRKQEILEL